MILPSHIDAYFFKITLEVTILVRYIAVDRSFANRRLLFLTVHLNVSLPKSQSCVFLA